VKDGPPEPDGERAAILYDAECGFCRWSADKILAWDVRRRLRPVALQDPEADRLLEGMDQGRKMASWHLVGADGRVRSAGDAIPELLRLLPGGAPLAVLAGVSPRATEAAYRWVSDHRDGLARLLGPRRRSVDPRRRRWGGPAG
jgi:predicted DCC family thiol-disulfide oxidoreductase YuxK